MLKWWTRVGKSNERPSVRSHTCQTNQGTYEYDGEVGLYDGDVGEYDGDVGEYEGDVGEYDGDVGEYDGEVGLTR